ncbi:MAG: hypothetical protein HY537_00690 [Deltaproteobacteria bacterium]|nr:hypothetical protein [Deltaproteobacteria bacterium]
MKAVLLHKSKTTMTVASGRTIAIYVDTFHLQGAKDPSSWKAYRFSWVAFAPDEPGARVLFDCHEPKGPHWHIDGDEVGQAFAWTGLEEAEELFFQKVEERFGRTIKE